MRAIETNLVTIRNTRLICKSPILLFFTRSLSSFFEGKRWNHPSTSTTQYLFNSANGCFGAGFTRLRWWTGGRCLNETCELGPHLPLQDKLQKMAEGCVLSIYLPKGQRKRARHLGFVYTYMSRRSHLLQDDPVTNRERPVVRLVVASCRSPLSSSSSLNIIDGNDSRCENSSTSEITARDEPSTCTFLFQNQGCIYNGAHVHVDIQSRRTGTIAQCYSHPRK